MASGQSLREFICKRLSAAAEEIFSEFEETIIRYEKEIARQRRLLELSWNPQINLHRIELPLHDIRKEEEILTDQQLWSQERSSSLDLEEPEPLQEGLEAPQIKVEQDEPELLQILEQDELSISQDEDQLVLKQEMGTSLVTPPEEERDHDDPEPVSNQLLFSAFPEAETGATAPQASTACPEVLRDHVWGIKEVLTDQQLFNQGVTSSVDQEEPEPQLINETQQELRIHLHEGPFILKQENVFLTAASPSEETDENQPLCQSSTEAENQDQDGCRNENSDSSRNEALTRNDQGDGQKLKKHSREKRVSCTICGRSFSGNRCLGIHMRMHKRKKPQPCKICGKCYSLWKPFNAHMMAHERRKEYPCEICGERFFLISIWASHMKTHTREEPRSCMFCGKRFFSNRNWTSHMRTHRLDAISM
nr:zinc finger and SCAN domain-containing protein 23 [Nothobranchius furzeri]